MADSVEQALVRAQTDMVAAALEYVDGRADDVYVYALCAAGAAYFDVFYRLSGTVVAKQSVNKAAPEGVQFDVSSSRQDALLGLGIAAIRALQDDCQQLGQPMPTEMKLHYVVAPGALDTAFRYDDFYTDASTVAPPSFFQTWRSEMMASA